MVARRRATQRFASTFAKMHGLGKGRNRAILLLLACAALAFVALVGTAARLYRAARSGLDTAGVGGGGGATSAGGQTADTPSDEAHRAGLQKALRGVAHSTEYWVPYANDQFNAPPLRPKASFDHDRYVTFEDDTGGWNNIRMAFEVFVVVAKATGRILVLPPRCRFYLLDRGPITAFDKAANSRETSSYDDYYDFDVLRKHVQIITTEQFLEREKAALGIPEELVETASKPQMVSNGFHSEYFLWLRECKDAVIWPSGPRFAPDFSLEGPEIHPEAKLLHFPMHVSKGLRYLGGAPVLLRNLPAQSVIEIKRFIRVALVYAPHIYRAAQAYIQLMGGFNAFTSLHIRRNELQYKSVFVSAEESARNVMPLVNPGEKVYLATDEMASGFFKPFSERGIQVLRMGDLRARVQQAIGPVNPKYEGMIEQVVCAAARTFAGTPYSSYTAHIMRLRGYMHDSATDPIERGCFYHTKDYSDSVVLRKEYRRCSSSFLGEIQMSNVNHGKTG